MGGPLNTQHTKRMDSLKIIGVAVALASLVVIGAGHPTGSAGLLKMATKLEHDVQRLEEETPRGKGGIPSNYVCCNGVSAGTGDFSEAQQDKGMHCSPSAILDTPAGAEWLEKYHNAPDGTYVTFCSSTSVTTGAPRNDLIIYSNDNAALPRIDAVANSNWVNRKLWADNCCEEF